MGNDENMKFNFKLKNLELRTCDKNLVGDTEHTTAEIIQWEIRGDEDKFCFVVAYWIKSREGYDLQFVGQRPFDTDRDIFWKLAKVGQTFLNETFNIME